jgi:hypothetical protein
LSTPGHWREKNTRRKIRRNIRVKNGRGQEEKDEGGGTRMWR